MNNKKPVRFATDVGPGESVTLDREIDVDATVEELTVRFYTGPELEVEVRPRIVPDGNGEPRSLVDLVGKDYIDGNGDLWQFDVSESVEEGDLLEVDIANTADPDPDLNLTYNITADVSLDREGGVLRPLRSVIDRVTGGL